MTRRVILSPEAEAQLDRLYRYIAQDASLGIATRYIDAVLERIERLADFPERGTAPDDIRTGMRTVPFRRRLTIAYAVFSQEVRILGIFSAGQDVETLLRSEERGADFTSSTTPPK